MMTRAHHLLAALCMASISAGAQAQVVRCTDVSTGKVTYTDGKCTGGAAAKEVEPRKTPEAIQQEREQAAEALARKQQRLQAENTAAETEAQRNAQRDRLRPTKSQDYARSPECARSRRNLDVVLSGSSGATYEQNLRAEAAQRQVDLDCLGPDGYTEVEKARAARPSAPAPVVVAPPYYPVRPHPVPAPTPTPAPKKFTQCNVFRCYDSQGNSTPR
ncbi:uncharacterized protein DUF4124 [Acidovorax sp. 69]|uniref:DUF4124 domain-containing protein n=1 Tax=Acidovorax sp. 69 TaxID=2035202 RepID=UPI000C248A7F|nr:DUF4124 domain-containing protein [Acidovorax sp. 69]PJI98677.1 uncharacterized protein DUF4124 [Acidovorax sp. 69]